MEKEVKARGVKKGQTPTWNVGRKTKPGFENKKVSVALPAWMWAGGKTENSKKQISEKYFGNLFKKMKNIL